MRWRRYVPCIIYSTFIRDLAENLYLVGDLFLLESPVTKRRSAEFEKNRKFPGIRDRTSFGWCIASLNGEDVGMG